MESLRAKAADPADVSGERPAQTVGGEHAKRRGEDDESFEILFNPSYLIDAVKSCADAGGGSGGVVFRMKAPLRPAVLKPAREAAGSQVHEAGDESEASRYSLKCLVMPMADPLKNEASS